ncbi:FadD3 family acyl-CoA ligase [Paraburkholderia silviterrae]|uniref:Fatty acid--CoA ligase family protein n=1 Tax=Paraburkholderia silviterrae TaxID=2528715 RepID=A0A4V2ZYS4_9BURK|nr:FadD3 family acyl-CoA ligase [Paraburkholderia silviterrae]TDG21770.1 fatty acid--CoA ligase family protein [Paraburkholderia silviterrae]
MTDRLPTNPTIPNLLAQSAECYADLTAIDDDSMRISYAELHRSARAVARALIALGVQHGERVAIWAPNIHEWIVAALGIHCAGAVLVPVNTRLKGAEAADILLRSQARVLFCIGEFLDVRYPEMLSDHAIPTLQHRVVLRDPQAGDAGWDAFLARGAGTHEAELEARLASIASETALDVLFTSGTTGRTKGVVTSHGQNLRAFTDWSEIVELTQGDRYLIVSPFFHAFGYKAGWLAALIRGATIVPQRIFDAESVLRRIAAERISFLPGSPTLYLSLLAHPRLAEFDLSSLRVAVTGASNVAPELIGRMQRELGFGTVVTAYGLTECCGLATVCRPGDDAYTVATTCGRPLDGVELRLVDETGRAVPTGTAGEVLIRGYTVMKGYLDDEAAVLETIDSEGWLHTGDIGTLDERGYLRITDRLKDMFIVGGFNCYPAEIENLLTEHPSIAQVAVIGVPDDRQGEVGKAYVVLRAGLDLGAEELIGWCRARMANYKVPRSVEFVAALPVNASGKVLKQSLRASAAPTTHGEVERPAVH